MSTSQEEEGETITLYVYDLSNGMAQSLGPMLVGRPVEGIWHTSIVLYGVEVWFGQGIHSKSPPGTTHHGLPRKRIPLGKTHLSQETFYEYLSGMRETYKAERYHLLEFNCNHFTNDVVGFLNGSTIPREILDQPKELMATPFGQQMRPMIEQMFVGANNRSAGDAVNNILPALNGANNSSFTPPTSSTPPTNQQSNDDVPSVESVGSNLQIVTSITSLRSTLARSPATAIMFTSRTCPPCESIKPFFEELARRNNNSDKRLRGKRIEFVLVQMGLGQGNEVAMMEEFGGPVRATPTFVFFEKGKKVGECKGADRGELETQVGMLRLSVYPPHPHEKLDLPALSKLSRTLSPITFPTFPPMPALSNKLSSSTASLDPTIATTLTKDVVAYLASLPTPPAQPPTPFPTSLIEPWRTSTLSSLSLLTDPTLKFPIVDLVRLALARDSLRLASQPKFHSSFFPNLVDRLVQDLDHDDPSHPYLLTAIRTISNSLTSPTIVTNIFSSSSSPTTAESPSSSLLSNVTKLTIRALLDRDEKMRSLGAGLAWSIVAKVYERRIDGTHEKEDGEEDSTEEEWEVEIVGAVLESLGREEKSLEVVHRLTATLGLLIYRSSHSTSLESFIEVLEGQQVLKQKLEQVKGMEGDKGRREEVLGVLKDVGKLVE